MFVFHYSLVCGRFLIELQHCITIFLIKSRDTIFNRLKSITKDTICLCNTNQSASCNQCLTCAVEITFAHCACPEGKIVRKSIIRCSLRIKNLLDDFSFNRGRRILLLEGKYKTIKKRFIHNVRSNVLPVIRSFSFGVTRCNNGEPRCMVDVTINLLQVNSPALKNGLKTKKFIRTKVHLVQQKNCTSHHCFDNWTHMIYSFAVQQTEPTK